MERNVYWNGLKLYWFLSENGEFDECSFRSNPRIYLRKQNFIDITLSIHLSICISFNLEAYMLGNRI